MRALRTHLGTAVTLIDEYYHCFNERRFIDAAAMFADDAPIEVAAGYAECGGAGYLRVAGTWMSAFPDAAMAVERVEWRSDTVCEAYLRMTGTHRGVLRLGRYQFPPTCASVTLPMRELLDIRDGTITGSMLTMDVASLVRELSQQVDYGELLTRMSRLCGLRQELEQSAGAGRHEIAKRIGIELDAAKRAISWR